MYSNIDNETYDNDHFNAVMARVDALKQNALNDNSVVPITEQGLNTAVIEQNRDKVCGEDRIDNEHIAHCGPLFRKTILLLLNAMLRRSYIPKEMQTGVPITLKLFERLLYKRIVLSINRHLNPLQGGLQKKMGCNMTSFIRQESMYYAK